MDIYADRLLDATLSTVQIKQKNLGPMWEDEWPNGGDETEADRS